MSMTDRDRKVILVLIPLMVLLGYWFLVLGPKRDESSKVAAKIPAARTAAESAEATEARLEGSRESFSADYAEMIRLGKAVPTSLDMPSLIVQLDEAARSTGIKFISLTRGEAATPAATPITPAPPAESGAGQTAQGAEQGVAAAQPAAPAEGGAAPAAAPANGAPPAAGGSAVPPAGLQAVPLELTFAGGFFELADLMHRIKRFVRVANERIEVNGRLLTVEGLKFESIDTDELKVTMSASIYLVPKAVGATAGATPSGPAGATPAAAPPPAGVSPPAAAVTQ